MRTYRDAEFRRQQQHREHLVETAETTGVDLAKIDRARLHQLLEDHTILTMLAGSDADRLDPAPNRRVTEDVIGTRWLLDPQRVELSERLHKSDRLVDVPGLIRVEHQH